MAGKAPKPRTRSSSTRKGRPSLCTPATMDAVVAAYEAGKGRKAAAVAAGISTCTLFEWLARGRAGEQPYAELLTRIEGARSTVIEGLRGVVLDLAHSEDPHVAGTNARWLLERLSPVDFGKRTELSGPHGGPVQVVAAVAPIISDQAIAASSPEQLAALLEAAFAGKPAPE